MNNEIRLLAAELSPGDSLRTICPVCEGGSTSEASLSIRKDDEGVVFKCFRDKCGYKGGFGGKRRKLVHTSIVPEKKEEAINHAVEIWERSYPIGELRAGMLQSMFRFDVEAVLQPREDPQNGRVLTPLYNRGKLAAFTSRRFYPHRSPKAITYQLHPDIPSLGIWGGHPPDTSLVIVEDVYSAGALNALGANSAALCGTSTTQDGWIDLAQFAARYTGGEAVMVLDEDATETAILTALRVRNLFRHIWAHPLRGPDIKNLPVSDRLILLERLKGEE